MSRELNSEILESFGVGPQGRKPTSKLKPDENRSVVLDSTELNVLSAKIESLKRITDANRAYIQNLESKVERMAGDSAVKVSNTQKYITRLEAYIKRATSELNAKHAVLTGKVTERSVNQVKIEELIQRHNKVINNFEIKLTELRKVIGEQEMQLLNYKSFIKSVR